MEIAVKAAAIALAGCVLAELMKKSGGHMTVLLATAVCCTLTALTLTAAESIADFAGQLTEFCGLSAPAVSIVLKTVGIALLTRLTADVCRDSGQSALASGTEFAGAAAAVYIAIPLMKTVLKMLETLMG